MRRGVFLDRDGTLIAAQVRDGRPYAATRIDEVVVLPGVRDGLNRLREAGFALVVVTNQPDVARGRQTRTSLEAIHTYLSKALNLPDIRVCWHDDADRCRCRKPKPGLILDAADEHRIDLPASFVVGDRWRDVVAGQAAGCRTILIEYDYDEPCDVEPDWRVRTLGEAVDVILAAPFRNVSSCA